MLRLGPPVTTFPIKTQLTSVGEEFELYTPPPDPAARFPRNLQSTIIGVEPSSLWMPPPSADVTVPLPRWAEFRTNVQLVTCGEDAELYIPAPPPPGPLK